MRVHQTAIIAQSLTKPPAAANGASNANNHNKESIRLFKAILFFCGDKKAPYPDTAITEIVQTGLESESLRGEVYAQLMKQLSENPNAASSGLRLWTLMAICLQFFPAGETLDYYIHCFVRAHAPARLRDALVAVAHSSAYLLEGSPGAQQSAQQRRGSMRAPPIAPTADQIPKLLEQAGISIGAGHVEVKQGRGARRLSVRS